MALFTGPVARTIGLILARFAVPLWILAGALFKLYERDYKLLPSSVTDTIIWLNETVIQTNTVAMFAYSMRAMIAVEIIAAGLMFFVHHVARPIGILILGLFCAILMIEIRRGAEDCGCFGAAGPPPEVMLAFDGSLLLGLLLFAAGQLKFDSRATIPVAGSLLTIVLGIGLAFGVPERTFTISNDNGQVDNGNEDDGTPSDNGDTPKTDRDNGTTTTTGWPAQPKIEELYVPEFDSWVGMQLSEIPMALQITRPMPKDINIGRWHVIFYSGTCDHCLELFMTHFTGELKTPTLTVRLPEGDPADDLPFPCTECIRHTLSEGPTYFFTPPILLTVVDGEVICVSTADTDNVQECLQAGREETNEQTTSDKKDSSS